MLNRLLPRLFPCPLGVHIHRFAKLAFMRKEPLSEQAVLAGPRAQLMSGDTGDEGEGWHVSRYQAGCTDGRALADGHAGQDNRARAYDHML